jgi:hypothetical protein
MKRLFVVPCVLSFACLGTVTGPVEEPCVTTADTLSIWEARQTTFTVQCVDTVYVNPRLP